MATKNKIFYRGFSSKNASKPGGSFTVTNIECVKADLMAHIFTSYYDRPHQPSFGTRIPTLAFEPNDGEVRQIIREDLTKVFNYDPRVKLLSLDIYSLPDNNAIAAIAKLLYIEFDVTGDLRIDIYSQ
jgi:phage baseplate assembly protein W